MLIPGYSASPLSTVAANARLLLEGFKTVFFDELKEANETYSKIFDVQKSSKHSEVVFDMVGLDIAPLSGEGQATTFQEFVNGGSRETPHLVYKNGYSVTRETLADDLYGITPKGMKQLPRTMKRRVESLCAGIVAGTFTTTKGLDPLTAAGIALCSTSHAYATGRSDILSGASTWANRPSSDSAPTPETLASAFLAGRKMKGREGIPLDVMYDTAILPPDLEQVMYKITKTTNKPFSNENTVNLNGSGSLNSLNLIVWPWLTSTSAWWLMEKANSPFIFYWREKPDFSSDFDKSNHINRYFAYMRCSADAYVPYHIYGTTG